ncbi:MAG TPA: hypothetical protein VK479_03170 [Micropepsaceae bacterium]|nr:hypothetical protein [Micropepsaceae bacterium]
MAFERPEIFVELCTAYANCGNQKLAATRCNVSEITFYRWLRESASGAAGYEMEYLGEKCLFHQAMKLADQILTYAVAGEVAKRSLLGSYRTATYKGVPTPIMAHDLPLDDPRYIPPDVKDDELSLLYGVHDRRARNPITGAVEYFQEHIEPPVALQLAFLASKLPKMWGSHSNVEVNSRTTGVLILKDKRTEAPRPAPVPLTTIAPPVAKPMAEIAAEPEIVEATADVEPVHDGGNETEPAAASPTRTMPTKLTPEQAAIKKRLLESSKYNLANAARKPGATEKTAEPVHAPAPSVKAVRPPPPQAGGRFESDDARRENIGTGTVRPGGFKVAG